VSRNSSLGFDADPVIHGGSDSLPAAKVSLRRLNRDLPKKELNLVRFAARVRVWPPLPFKSMIAQCSSRSWT
jgi:hypothetical protein